MQLFSRDLAFAEPVGHAYRDLRRQPRRNNLPCHVGTMSRKPAKGEYIETVSYLSLLAHPPHVPSKTTPNPNPSPPFPLLKPKKAHNSSPHPSNRTQATKSRDARRSLGLRTLYSVGRRSSRQRSSSAATSCAHTRPPTRTRSKGTPSPSPLAGTASSVEDVS